MPGARKAEQQGEFRSRQREGNFVRSPNKHPTVSSCSKTFVLMGLTGISICEAQAEKTLSTTAGRRIFQAASEKCWSPRWGLKEVNIVIGQYDQPRCVWSKLAPCIMYGICLHPKGPAAFIRSSISRVWQNMRQAGWQCGRPTVQLERKGCRLRAAGVSIWGSPEVRKGSGAWDSDLVHILILQNE